MILHAPDRRGSHKKFIVVTMKQNLTGNSSIKCKTRNTLHPIHTMMVISRKGGKNTYHKRKDKRLACADASQGLHHAVFLPKGGQHNVHSIARLPGRQLGIAAVLYHCRNVLGDLLNKYTLNVGSLIST